MQPPTVAPPSVLGAPPQSEQDTRAKDQVLKNALEVRMERGEVIVTRAENLNENKDKPWLYGYGVRFLEQGDGDIKIGWHFCPKDLTHVPPGIRRQCSMTPEQRRDNPLYTPDFK
jgi:hypothetical protein